MPDFYRDNVHQRGTEHTTGASNRILSAIFDQLDAIRVEVTSANHAVREFLEEVAPRQKWLEDFKTDVERVLANASGKTRRRTGKRSVGGTGRTDTGKPVPEPDAPDTGRDRQHYKYVGPSCLGDPQDSLDADQWPDA